jgi:two-component system, OmpR family, phosphate regulon sensor histidine kinase PhoR
MKKAVIRNNILLLLSAFILFFIIVFFSLYQFEKRHQSSMMTFLLDEVETSYENFDLGEQVFVYLYNQSKRRITILDENGFVIADTHDQGVGTDKSQRPEILDLGNVYIRKTDTINIELLYIATRLDNEHYLRVSIPLESQITTYRQALWTLSISGVIVIGIFYLALLSLNKNLLKPWDKVKQGLILLNKGSYQMMTLNSPYEEINELLYEMNEINYETSKYLNQIKNYQKQLNFILNEIKQSILLFDKDQKLIFYNKDAIKLFDLSDSFLNQNSYKFIRDVTINEAIEHAIDQEKIFHQDVKIKEDTYDCHVFPLHKADDQYGLASILVTLKNVSDERQIGQMKRDFFSHASHELKSPLAAIRGYSELVLYDMVNKEQDIKDISLKIVNQTKYMAALVEDMLMLSRLENIKEETYQDIELKQILFETVDTLKQTFKDKDISLNIDAEAVYYYGDPIDFSKMFKNLIENAYKYSDDKTSIDVTLKKDVQNIVFQVKDKGRGIAKEHQNRVFERFYRVDKGRLDGGTGLGLAIVKHIVIKYEGSINLKSQIQKGTEISIHLKHI